MFQRPYLLGPYLFGPKSNFRTYTKFSGQLTFPSRACAYQGKRDVTFSESLCTYEMYDP